MKTVFVVRHTWPSTWGDRAETGSGMAIDYAVERESGPFGTIKEAKAHIARVWDMNWQPGMHFTITERQVPDGND